MFATTPTAADWQQTFVVSVLPIVQKHASFKFRHLLADARDEAVQEAIASACVSYRRLAVQNRLHVAIPGTLAMYAVKQVRAGRHVGGRLDSSRDVLSRRACRRHDIRVTRIGDEGDARLGWETLVVAGRRESVADAAAFRVDFADWLSKLGRRDRMIIRMLVAGESPSGIAGRLSVSPPRLSQLRRRYEQLWNRYQAQAA